MKCVKYPFLLLLACLWSLGELAAQRPYWEMMQDSVIDLPGATAAFEQFWQGREPEKGQGYKQFKRWQFMQEMRADDKGKVPPMGAEAAEMLRWEQEEGNLRRTSTVPTGNWSLLGPLTNPVNTSGQPEGLGRTSAVAFHPTDPNTLYLGAPAGGLWMTTNNGGTWTTTTDFLPSIGVSAVIVTPGNPNIIYIGIGDKDASDASSLGVYKSINGGATWTVSNTGMGNRTIHNLIIDPDDDTKIIAATNNGVYRSLNSGANWTQILAAGTVYQVGYRPGSTNTLYAINGTNLYTSVDDGATWNAGVAVGASTARAAFATTPASPMDVFIVKNIGANPVFKSSDGGATIAVVQVDGKLLLNGDCTGGGSGGQGWYDICIAVDPTNANNVMVGGVSIWKSVNGGANFSIAGCWSSMGTNVHADHHFMAWSPHFPTRLMVCNDGGLYQTDNLGVNYTYLSSGVAVTQMYRMAQSTTRPGYLVAGLQDNGMIICHAPTWTISIGGDGLDCAVDPTNDNYQYGSYVYGVIRRSTNAGANWGTIGQNGLNGITESGPWLTPYAINPANPNIMIAGYTSIWRTTNVKAFPPTFTNVNPLTGSSIRDITFIDGNTAYASRANGEFYQSLDAGLTWTLKTNPPGGAAKDITGDPGNPQNIWVASGNDVYKSVDGGTTWTIWDTGLPGISCLTVAYDYIANAVYCGMWTGVYYRHATGPSWTSFSTNLPRTQALHLQIYYGSGGCIGRDKLRLGTYGRGMWESDLYAPPTLAPVACFGADTLFACANGSSVVLQDSSAYDPTSWSWTVTGPGTVNYINSTSATSQNPEVTFSMVGTYDVSLLVTNGNGSHATSRVGYITVVNPTANFSTLDTLIYTGKVVNFTDASSSCTTTWAWDFGDGFTSTLRNPTHVYATAGYYNVTLVIDGGLGTRVRSNYIHVLPHFAVPYTSATTGWTGDMENPSTAWHYGSRSNFGGLNAWQRGSVSLTFPPAASGANCWATLLGANVTGGYSQASVWCPSFDMSAAGRYQIRLKTAMEVTTCNSPYGAMVQYTTDNGTTWTRLGSKQGVDPNAFASWYNIGGTSGCDWITGTPAGQGWCYTGTTFRQTIYDASALAGNPKVGFRVAFFPIGLAPFGKGFAFDDFELDFTPIPGIVDTIPGSLAQFDGINDYVETYFGGNLPAFTAEGWVLSSAAPSNTARTSILAKTNVLELNWNHPSVGSQGSVALRNTLGTWQNYSFGPLAANTWYHLAVAFDGTTVRTYKNGELITNAAFSGTLDANTNSWQLGRGTAYFNGQLDEFRIWNAARTTQQIREAMHRTLDQPELANVALYYQGNETSGYLKDPATLRNGYLMGGLGRTLSPVAVGKGVSQTLTVSGIGSYNFATCGLVLDYTAFAGAPQAVTVTRIQQFVNEQLPNPLYNNAPNTTLVDKNQYFYHAVNAFGAAVFSTNITANGVPNISPAEALAPANLKLVKRPSNGVSLWDLGIPAVAATASSGPTVFDGSATWNGITGFSQLFIGKEIGGPVPVEDLQFQVFADQNSVWLYWEPLGQPGDGDWFVERSLSPSVVGTIWRAANPGRPSYQVEDQNVAGSELWFYRLHQYNANGESRQSEWRMADLGNASSAIKIYPNPNAGSFTVEWINSEAGIATLELIDAAGRRIWSSETEALEGVNRIAVSAGNIATGIYSMRVMSFGKQQIQRIVIR